MYVRQGRRILGDYVLTERDADLDSTLARTRVQSASIGIVEWAFDSHGVRRYDAAHPGVREGYTMVAHEPFQIPFGVLVPRQIDGLLVPVACSCSHVAYNALRMEPVFMALGEASGIAAHLAIRDALPVRRVPTAQLQKLLVERGGVITFYEDLKFDHPAFAAFQWLGARVESDYKATPDLKLARAEGWTRLGRILRAEGKSWTQPHENPEAELRGGDLADWLKQAGCKPKDAGFKALQEQPLSLTQFAQLVYHTLTP